MNCLKSFVNVLDYSAFVSFLRGLPLSSLLPSYILCSDLTFLFFWSACFNFWQFLMMRMEGKAGKFGYLGPHYVAVSVQEFEHIVMARTSNWKFSFLLSYNLCSAAPGLSIRLAHDLLKALAESY